MKVAAGFHDDDDGKSVDELLNEVFDIIIDMERRHGQFVGYETQEASEDEA